MTATVVRRAAEVLGAVVGTALLVGALPWLSGTDPARAVLRAREEEGAPDAAALQAVRDTLDLPADPVTGTLGFLGRLATGDLGTSWVSRTPVADTVLPALGISLTLAGTASVVALLLAGLLTVPALLRAADGRLRGGGPGAALGGALSALPEFVLAVLLVAVVAVGWGLLPTSGFTGPEHLVLPVLALALPAAGVLARLLAGAVAATAGESWVRTWRAAGVARRTTAAALGRRAVGVVVPQVLLLLVGTLGAAAVVEAVFDVPGLGGVALSAALAQDVPVVQAAVVLLVAIGLLVGGGGVLAHRLLLGPALATSGFTPETARAGRRPQRVAVAVAGVLAVAVVAGLLRDPSAQDVGRRLAPPSWALPLGADPLGRDVLARFGHGALLSVGLAAVLAAVALGVGLAVGLLGRGGRSGPADVLNALPAVVVGIVVAAVAGPGLLAACVAVALVGWIPLAVHTRTLAAQARASGFHVAAVAGGAGRWHVLRRHLLPVVGPPVVRHALVRVPHASLALAGLSFLGLGAGAESPEWGRALAETTGYLERAPWVVAAPVTGLVLLGVVAALADPAPGR
ncbi:ABC transporter permease subunit [Klenkia taihuensis]|uniref:Peptide/nickel transport system permease protein n=1 Tax=Klenkia taihuensis TaxID=1225127 RepID=A0A1I1TKL8_9ACTN|nr:ABC transporter permease subunit [Klenkia taihuensis]GHE12719.1 ABC transporter permease [Klenkia taihuensis]SFD59192.1 peptide/nickel transport system permease protein [Klenkia taihuensis]